MQRDQWRAERLLKVSGSYWEACTLHAAVALDVFSVLATGSLTAAEVAEKLAVDERGVTVLLNALAAMDLIRLEQGRYHNSRQSQELLVRGSPGYTGYIIQHHHHLVRAWSRLPEAVRTGRPVRRRSGQYEEEERRSFLMGMFNLAMAVAPRVASLIPLAGRSRLLDLGGGPGTYAIHFCLANPRLRASIYDLPTTRPFAQETVERFGLSDRIDFIAGDYLVEAITGSYDVVWLSHILHGEGPEDCRNILRKCASVLQKGGLIFVHDFILNDTMNGPLFPALFSLNMLLNTAQGRAYSESQIREMLTGAGIDKIERLPFRGPNDSGILRGER